MLPHLSYADAVHATLVDAERVPDNFTVSARASRRELVVAMHWKDVAVRWSSEEGCRHDAPQSGGLLSLDRFAAPSAIAATVGCLLVGQQPIARQERWDDARRLDLAITEWERLRC